MSSEKKEKKTGYEVKYENLAMPEVKVDPQSTKDEEIQETKESVSYDSLAVPEIHIRKR